MQQIEDNIAEMAFTGEVHVENLDNRTVVFLMSYYLAEQNVCKCLSMINDAGLKPVAGKIDSLIQRTERSTGDLSFGESETCGDQLPEDGGQRHNGRSGYRENDYYQYDHKYPGGQWSENRYRGTYRACCKENN